MNGLTANVRILEQETLGFVTTGGCGLFSGCVHGAVLYSNVGCAAWVNLLPEREPKQAWSTFRVQYLRPAGGNFKVTKTCL